MKGDQLSRWRCAQRKESEFWRSRVNEYEDEWRREQWDTHLKLLGFDLRTWSERRILEVGCGPKGIVNYLEAGLAIGVDPLATTYVDLTELRARYVNGMGETLPFPDNTFDACFSINSLDHCFSPWDVISEMVRALRPGGDLVLHTDLASPLRRVLKRLTPDGEVHPQDFYLHELLEMLARAGVRVGYKTRDMGAYQYYRQNWRNGVALMALADFALYRFNSNMFHNHVWLSGKKA